MKNYLQNSFDPELLVQYFDELPLWSAPFGLKLLDVIDYKKNISALDIGFGTGFPLTEIAMRLGTSCKIYGIDPWTLAVERTRQKIKFYQIHNITLFEGIAENIPLEDKSIDLMLSNNGLNNVQDIEKVLSECSRISRSNAQFVLTMNLDKTMFEMYDQLEIILQERNLTEEVKLLYHHIYEKRRPLQEMINKLTLHGFEVINVIHDSFKYRFADGSAMFNHYFIRMAFMDSWKILLPENLLVEIFEELEKRLNMLATRKGELTLTIPFVVIDSRKSPN